MITTHSKNVATFVSTSNPHTKASTMPRVDPCWVSTQLLGVRFAKWDYKNEDQTLENSNLLSI